MDIPERIHWLRQTDLFQSFSDDELFGFAGGISELALNKDDLLFEEGDPGDDLYILLEGELAVLKEGRAVATITSVNYVGEMAIIETKPRSATVQAVRRCRLFKITSTQFQHYLAGQPQALVAMMKTLSQRIRHDTEILAQEFEKTNILIHDMKNMLSAFLFLDRLQKEKKGEESGHGRYIGIMRNACRNLTEMMEEALANAKRLRRPYTMEKGSIEQLVRDLMDSELKVHPDLEGKVLRIELDPAIPVFLFCQRDIRRVLTNLLLNSAQASKAGDTITVRALHRDNHVEIRIIDVGCGIPASLCDKVLQTHFTTKEKGSGLGLASCRQIVEDRHGGRLFFTSEFGKGATFVFTLPYGAA